MRPAMLSAGAGLALAFGFLVYAVERDAARVALMPVGAMLSIGPVFGTLGLWLPSFVHPFAFSLLTVAARPASAAPAYGACAAWWAVNVAFELGQHPAVSERIAERLTGVPNWVPLARALSNYLLGGTFDPADLLASTLGALAAAAVLRVAAGRR